MLERRFSPLLPLFVAASLASCSRPAAPPSGGSSPAAQAPGATASPTASAVPTGAVVAEVNGEEIRASELDARASSRLARLRQEEYSIREQALGEIVAARLLAAEAARRGIAVEELLRLEVDAKTTGPDASAAESIYEQNKARFAGQSKAEALERIRSVLAERARASRRAQLESELRGKAKVSVLLEPPRTQVAIPGDAPSRGPAQAPITIVEFTDYQCPFCHRAQGVMDQILARYDGKLRLVHLDFPLDGHPGAVPAARAARCAGDQGQFWEYHHGLMTAPGLLDEADLRSRAQKLGLDAAKFGACLASPRHDAAIRAGFAQGEALGVTGTPAYFINGRLVSGAQPYEEFVRVVDAELLRR